jgi:hypothetical protein
MQELLNVLPAEWRPLAWAIFIIFGAVGAAITFARGQKKGPPEQKVQEFAMTGQLSDMGPVRELVELMGLLVQQQIRTNIHLESLAEEAGKGVAAYSKHLLDVEIEEEVERRMKARDVPNARRSPPTRT